jgi:poly-gamma-glutamate capsule biosynthesis protein CapA/YwtB (metallophosphatase superfamily)
MALGSWSRREFLWMSGGATVAAGTLVSGAKETPSPVTHQRASLFLCGDVMTGRGIDQILPHPSKREIYESYMKSALRYVELAEQANGAIPRPVDYSHIWGDVLGELAERSPDRRIVNLETSVTTSDAPAHKGINYRMHPKNVPCLSAARIDCCVLSNNHVLDWGVAGLLETLSTLRDARISTAGAGATDREAARPAVLELAGNRRILVFGFGAPSSGIPESWAAAGSRPGIRFLPDLSEKAAARVIEEIRAHRRAGDVVVASIHWGGNWGYEVPPRQREFARRLIDAGAVDVLHGHSSHHPKGVEVYHGRLILYGCGDFINDYEGISGYEKFRSDLVVAYFVALDATSGELVGLAMVPFRMARFRLQRANREEMTWLRDTLDRESRPFAARVVLTAKGSLALRW